MEVEDMKDCWEEQDTKWILQDKATSYTMETPHLLTEWSPSQPYCTREPISLEYNLTETTIALQGAYQANIVSVRNLHVHTRTNAACKVKEANPLQKPTEEEKQTRRRLARERDR